MINIPDNFKLIFKALAGSHLYGTNTPESDYDERGVFIASEEYFLGFMNRVEQFEDKNNDITFFELRKFLHLACENNPNILELLWIPESMFLTSSEEWEEIIENRHLFISKKAKHTFSGYAHSQFNRVKRHRSWLLNPPKKKPERKDFGLSAHRSDLTKDQIGAFNVLLALKLENIKELHPLKQQLEQMAETHDLKALCTQYTEVDLNALKEIIPISNEFIEILQKENAYAQAERYFNQYQNWKKNRNPVRAAMEDKFGYDGKHCSHLFRLVTEAEELLTTGFITFPRPDAEFLLEIKNGKYKYDELAEMLESYDKKFEELYKTSPLPNSADRVSVDKLCIKLVKNYLGINKINKCKTCKCFERANWYPEGDVREDGRCEILTRILSMSNHILSENIFILDNFGCIFHKEKE